jgi:membrane protease YdiL (CAAX protease family)
MSLYLVSAAICSAIHSSNGLETMAGRFVIRLMPLWLILWTTSLLPEIAAHYFVSLALFWPQPGQPQTN